MKFLVGKKIMVYLKMLLLCPKTSSTTVTFSTTAAGKECDGSSVNTVPKLLDLPGIIEGAKDGKGGARQMSHRYLAIELQQFNILHRSMDEVIGKFLRDQLQPVESIIAPIGMEDASRLQKLNILYQMLTMSGNEGDPQR